MDSTNAISKKNDEVKSKLEGLKAQWGRPGKSAEPAAARSTSPAPGTPSNSPAPKPQSVAAKRPTAEASQGGKVAEVAKPEDKPKPVAASENRSEAANTTASTKASPSAATEAPKSSKSVPRVAKAAPPGAKPSTGSQPKPSQPASAATKPEVEKATPVASPKIGPSAPATTPAPMESLTKDVTPSQRQGTKAGPQQAASQANRPSSASSPTKTQPQSAPGRTPTPTRAQAAPATATPAPATKIEAPKRATQPQPAQGEAAATRKPQTAAPSEPAERLPSPPPPPPPPASQQASPTKPDPSGRPQSISPQKQVQTPPKPQTSSFFGKRTSPSASTFASTNITPKERADVEAKLASLAPVQEEPRVAVGDLVRRFNVQKDQQAGQSSPMPPLPSAKVTTPTAPEARPSSLSPAREPRAARKKPRKDRDKPSSRSASVPRQPVPSGADNHMGPPIAPVQVPPNPFSSLSALPAPAGMAMATDMSGPALGHVAYQPQPVGLQYAQSTSHIAQQGSGPGTGHVAYQAQPVGMQYAQSTSHIAQQGPGPGTVHVAYQPQPVGMQYAQSTSYIAQQGFQAQQTFPSTQVAHVANPPHVSFEPGGGAAMPQDLSVNLQRLHELARQANYPPSAHPATSQSSYHQASYDDQHLRQQYGAAHHATQPRAQRYPQDSAGEDSDSDSESDLGGPTSSPQRARGAPGHGAPGPNDRQSYFYDSSPLPKASTGGFPRTLSGPAAGTSLPARQHPAYNSIPASPSSQPDRTATASRAFQNQNLDASYDSSLPLPLHPLLLRGSQQSPNFRPPSVTDAEDRHRRPHSRARDGQSSSPRRPPSNSFEGTEVAQSGLSSQASLFSITVDGKTGKATVRPQSSAEEVDLFSHIDTVKSHADAIQAATEEELSRLRTQWKQVTLHQKNLVEKRRMVREQIAQLRPTLKGNEEALAAAIAEENFQLSQALHNAVEQGKGRMIESQTALQDLSLQYEDALRHKADLADREGRVHQSCTSRLAELKVQQESLRDAFWAERSSQTSRHQDAITEELERIKAERSHVVLDSKLIEEEEGEIYNTINQSTKGAIEEKKKWEAQYDNLQAEIEALMRLIQAKREEQASCKANIETCSEKIETVKTRFSKQLQRIDEKKEELRRAEQQCSKDEERLREAQQKLEEDLETLHAADARFADGVSKIQIDIDRFLDLIRAAREKKLDAEAAARRRENCRGVVTQEELETMAVLKESLEKIQSNMLELSAKLISLQKQASDFRLRIAALDAKVPELEAEKKLASYLFEVAQYKEAARVTAEIKGLMEERSKDANRLQQVMSSMSAMLYELERLKDDSGRVRNEQRAVEDASDRRRRELMLRLVSEVQSLMNQASSRAYDMSDEIVLLRGELEDYNQDLAEIDTKFYSRAAPSEESGVDLAPEEERVDEVEYHDVGRGDNTFAVDDHDPAMRPGHIYADALHIESLRIRKEEVERTLHHEGTGDNVHVATQEAAQAAVERQKSQMRAERPAPPVPEAQPAPLARSSSLPSRKPQAPSLTISGPSFTVTDPSVPVTEPSTSVASTSAVPAASPTEGGGMLTKLKASVDTVRTLLGVTSSVTQKPPHPPRPASQNQLPTKREPVPLRSSGKPVVPTGESSSPPRQLQSSQPSTPGRTSPWGEKDRSLFTSSSQPTSPHGYSSRSPVVDTSEEDRRWNAILRIQLWYLRWTTRKRAAKRRQQHVRARTIMEEMDKERKKLEATRERSQKLVSENFQSRLQSIQQQQHQLLEAIQQPSRTSPRSQVSSSPEPRAILGQLQQEDSQRRGSTDRPQAVPSPYNFDELSTPGQSAGSSPRSEAALDMPQGSQAQPLSGSQSYGQLRPVVPRLDLGVIAYDNLNLSSDPTVKRIFQAFSTKESITFSEVLEKVDRRNKTQRRAIMITDRAIYCLMPRTLNLCWRIDLVSVKQLVVCSTGDNLFAIQVPSDDDHIMRPDPKGQVIRHMRRNYELLIGAPLPFFAEAQSLEYYVGPDGRKRVLVHHNLASEAYK